VAYKNYKFRPESRTLQSICRYDLNVNLSRTKDSVAALMRSSKFLCGYFAECGGMENGDTDVHIAKTTVTADGDQPVGTHLEKEVKYRWRLLLQFS
jgi:hypothetical protein